jgi:hypothetical protein
MFLHDLFSLEASAPERFRGDHLQVALVKRFLLLGRDGPEDGLTTENRIEEVLLFSRCRQQGLRGQDPLPRPTRLLIVFVPTSRAASFFITGDRVPPRTVRRMKAVLS